MASTNNIDETTLPVISYSDKGTSGPASRPVAIQEDPCTHTQVAYRSLTNY